MQNPKLLKKIDINIENKTLDIFEFTRNSHTSQAPKMSQ